jgi:carbonic anhydrase
MHLLLYFFIFTAIVIFTFLFKKNTTIQNRVLDIKKKSKMMFRQMTENNFEDTPISELSKNTWDYKENGMDWPEFPYLVSPINIKTNSTIKKIKNDTILFHYPIEKLNLYGNNNGRSVYFLNPNELYFIEYNKEYYRFQEMCYHHSSEHSINSISYDAEIQFVHRTIEDKILIVSVLVEYKEGSNPTFYNKFFKNTFDDVPNFKSKKNISYKGESKIFDLNNLFNKELKSSPCYLYKGSFTVPAYIEKTVTWVVFKNPIKIPHKLNEIDGLENNSTQIKENKTIPILELI